MGLLSSNPYSHCPKDMSCLYMFTEIQTSRLFKSSTPPPLSRATTEPSHMFTAKVLKFPLIFGTRAKSSHELCMSKNVCYIFNCFRAGGFSGFLVYDIARNRNFPCLLPLSIQCARSSLNLSPFSFMEFVFSDMLRKAFPHTKSVYSCLFLWFCFFPFNI